MNSKQHVFGMRHEFHICLFLFIFILANYWQVSNFEFIGFDDNYYITENRHVQKGLTPESIRWAFSFDNKDNTYWHPITWLSHMTDVHLYGMDAGSHHISNVILHIINSLLLFYFLRKTTGALWKSAFAALIFGLHPLNIESVAWVSERKNVLSTFFWIITMICYCSYSKQNKRYYYVFALLSFLSGLMTKPMLVTIPFVLLLLDYWPLNRFDFKRPDRLSVIRLLIEKIPFFILSAVSIYISLLSLEHNNAVVSTDVVPMKLRIENALVSYWVYIGKMLYPVNLSVFYPFPQSVPAWQSISAAVLLIAASFVFIYYLRQKPYAGAGWLWFLGTLVPVLGLKRAGLWPAAADRWTYIPHIGLFIIIAWGVPAIIEKWRLKKFFLIALTVIISSAMMLVLQWQLRYWENSIALFERAVQINPNNNIAHYNLAYIKNEAGRTEEAIIHYNEALRINPKDTDSRFNLGIIYADQGKSNEAIAHYAVILRLNPHDLKARNNIGIALMQSGGFDEAIEHFSKILNIAPDEDVHNNMGIALVLKGNTKQAIFHFQEALKINPESDSAKENLNRALKMEYY